MSINEQNGEENESNTDFTPPNQEVRQVSQARHEIIPTQAVEDNSRLTRVRRKISSVARQTSQTADMAILKSRESRLKTEEKNRKSGIQKFFSRKVVGWIARTVAQAIPSPIGYGPGDIITGASAIIGKDILSGEHLDMVDRGLYAVATAIPGVPATILVTPARFLRKSIENAYFSHKNKQAGGVIKNTKTAIDAGKQITNAIQQSGKKK